MDNENKNYNKKDTGNLKIVISILLLVVLVLGEVYFMINDPTNFIVLIVLTVVTLADVYVLIASTIQQNYKKELDRYEQYDNLFKSEKASYLIIRKSFEEVEDRLDRIEEASGVPTDEIINAQKSIAKVSINRNKENTDALMNSNDKMIEKLFSLEDTLDNNNSELLSKQQTVIENANKDLIMKQQEMIAGLRELELSIKNEILSATSRIHTAPQVVMGASAGMQMDNTVQMSSPQIMATDEVQMPVETAQVSEPAMKSIEEDNSLFDDALGLEDDTELSETQDFSETNEMFQSKEEIEIEPPLEMFAKTLANQEQEQAKESVFDTGLDEELPDLDALFSSEEIANAEELPSIDDDEEIETPEPVIAPASNIADANRIMTPEEIAALIAGTSNDVEEPVIAEEPIIEAAEEPEVAKEAEPAVTPGIDLSDPNRMMTPDEIAALFANA